VAHEIRIGTSGWTYQSWRGVLYEAGLAQGRWLECYAESFDTVELNASFYRLPSADQFASWKKRTPSGFAFAVKGSRFVTHVRQLQGVEEAVSTFLEHARGLGRKGSVTLWQLPPSLECDVDRLGAFLKLLPRAKTRRQAVEFRHESWYVDEVYGLLERYGVALVLPDSAARENMNVPELRHTSDFTYLRFHHGAGREGHYTDAQLREWAKRIAGWRRRCDVYAYFNNDWKGFAVRNALRLRELLD
jgi:uncharacterized protein YecE (DUF72 family)